MKIREGQIERTRKMITFDGKIRKNRKNPNDPARFIEEIHVTDSREVADDVIATLNEEAIANEEMYDGFKTVITNIDEMGYIPSYTRTELTDALHENAGFRTDTQIVKKSKLRTVIRSTKDKK